jgi:hypothetical protein
MVELIVTSVTHQHTIEKRPIVDGRLSPWIRCLIFDLWQCTICPRLTLTQHLVGDRELNARMYQVSEILTQVLTLAKTT